MAPGGYIEHSEPLPGLKSDDGSIAPGNIMLRCTALANEASQKFGKNLSVARLLKKMIEEAGFVDVVEKHYKWPIGTWPVDHRLKDIGRWNLRHWIEGLEAWTLRLLTQHCGVSQPSVLIPCVNAWLEENCIRSWLTAEQWTPNEVKDWSARMRLSLTDPKHHAYHTMYVELLAFVLKFECQD